MDSKATFNINLPMPDVGKAEADYNARTNGGSVDVNIHVTSDGGKGSGNGNSGMIDIGGHMVHESWLGMFGDIGGSTAKPIENLIGLLEGLGNASDHVSQKLNEAMKAMVVLENEYNDRRHDKFNTILSNNFSQEDILEALGYGKASKNKSNNAGGGGRNILPARPGGGNGSNGGSGTPPPSSGSPKLPDEIRIFESLNDLKKFLSSLNLGAYGDAIEERLKALTISEKKISASFDSQTKELRDVSVFGTHAQRGSAEQAGFTYRFGKNTVGEYELRDSSATTRADIAKIQQYEKDVQQRTATLLNTLQGMYDQPILKNMVNPKTGKNSNPLFDQLQEIARIDPADSLLKLVRRDANGNIEYINKPERSDVEAASAAADAVKAGIKAINDRIVKKWANSSIEQMEHNVGKMRTDAGLLPKKFAALRVEHPEKLLDEFNKASKAYDASVGDPNKQVEAYNQMARALETVNQKLKERRELVKSEDNADKQLKKLNDAAVQMRTIRDQYKEMGVKPPQEFYDAMKEMSRYKISKDPGKKAQAFYDFNKFKGMVDTDIKDKYPKWQEQQKRSEKMAKDNRRTYRLATGQNQKTEKLRKELATLAEPYGGLESGNLPDYLQKAVDTLQSLVTEKNIETRASRMKNLESLVSSAKYRINDQKNLDEARALLSRMDTTNPMMVTPADQLQRAIDQVNGLNDQSTPNQIADAYANLAARLREATDAMNAYEKAATDAEKSQNAIDNTVNKKWSQYENFTKQLENIKLAYEKMGKTAPTASVDALMDQLFNADVMDPKALKSIISDLGIEMKRLGELRTFDKAVFDATNKRDTKTNGLNDWISGLNIDDRNLQKIQDLRAVLQALNAIDLTAPNQLTAFNTQLTNVDKIAEDAKKLVDIRQRYRDVINDKNYGLLGGEHGAANRAISLQMKTDLENAHAAFVANPDDVATMQALADALQVVEERLGNISQIDAFGKLNEQAQKVEQSMNFLTSKHGATNTWKPAQQAVASSYNNLMQQYNTQVGAGNLSGATEYMTQLNNQVTALNQSFKSGSGLVGVYDGKLSGLVTRILGVGSGFMAVNKVINTYKKMAGYVTQIDTAMTELKKVTDESSAAYNRFQKQSGQTAIAIGSSITDLINTSVEYGRMGYNLAESQQLGVTTTKFANTGNFNSVTDASDALIAIIRGFDELDIGDAEKVSDKLTAVANAYAVTASDIAAGLQRSASALNLGGVNVDQATAMITAISEVTRDSSAAGNAIKTMSMRIRGAKTE